jgi:tRNA U34 2-thiouridine synthase MnmA/TrmU
MRSRVADRLGIPFHSLNFQQEFKRIKDYFADEYLAGRTPNPCVQCNNWLKFGKLWDFAQQVEARYIATGHYARIQQNPSDDWGLYRGDDDNKDQSYVLFGIRRELLPNILLPIGTYEKPAIRELARDAGLRVASKKTATKSVLSRIRITRGFSSDTGSMKALKGILWTRPATYLVITTAMNTSLSDSVRVWGLRSGNRGL